MKQNFSGQNSEADHRRKQSLLNALVKTFKYPYAQDIDGQLYNCITFKKK